MSNRQRSGKEPAAAEIQAIGDRWEWRDAEHRISIIERTFHESTSAGRFRGFGRLVKVVTYNGVFWRTLRRGEVYADTDR